MKKQELKDFDVVEYRYGSRRLLLGEGIIDINGNQQNSLKCYNDDLIDSDGTTELDIVKVWRFKRTENIELCLKKAPRLPLEPLWIRQEYPTLEIEEMRKVVNQLQNLFK